jgi:uncharacterized protein involved in type VI secretion and phage assembly
MSKDIYLTDFESEKVRRLYGFYRAKVVDNKDPNKYGRVKVWIPSLFIDIPTNEGVWARPANNSVGGRNTEMGNEGDKYWGSLNIPIVGSWVWIFFEGGNINNPYYFASLDIENTKVPPENQQGNEYQSKWTILRTPKGRVIILSDDPDDERVEITGKKKTISDVYTIDGNQKTILIDERSGKEKILIKDEKGNYINIDTKDQDIHIYNQHDYNQKVDNDYSLTVGKDVKIKINGDFYLDISGDMNVKVGGNIKVESGSNTNIKSGSAINLQSGSDSNIKAGGSFNAQAGGNANIKSGSGAFLNGNSVDILGSGPVKIHGAGTSIQRGASPAGSAGSSDSPTVVQPNDPEGEREG